MHDDILKSVEEVNTYLAEYRDRHYKVLNTRYRVIEELPSDHDVSKGAGVKVWAISENTYKVRPDGSEYSVNLLGPPARSNYITEDKILITISRNTNQPIRDYVKQTCNEARRGRHK